MYGDFFFLERDDPEQEPLKLYYPYNVRTPLPFPKTWILGYQAGGDNGSIAVTTSGSGHSQMISRLFDQIEEILGELPEGSEFKKSNRGNFMFHTGKPAKDFMDDDAMRKWISETLNAYSNALRPRLKGLA